MKQGRHIVFVLCSLAILTYTISVQAYIIETTPMPPYWYGSGFGPSIVYVGQTFRLPEGPDVQASRITVFLGTQVRSGVFRLLITDVDTTSGFHPTTVLFESETLNAPDSRHTQIFEIDLGGLHLLPEHDYAWILDYFVVGDPESFVDMSVGLGSYPDGFGFHFIPSPFYPTGTRQDHFASNEWFWDVNSDYAFQLVVIPPELLTLHLTNDTVEIQFLSQSNKQYALEQSENLASWVPIEEEILGTGSTIILTNQAGEQKKGFYRTKRSDEFFVSIPTNLLSIGNEWTYSVTETIDGVASSYVEVSTNEGYSVQNGIPVLEMVDYSNDKSLVQTSYIQLDCSEGLFEVGYNDPDEGQFFSDPPEPLFYSRFTPGVQSNLVLMSSDPGIGPMTMVVTMSIQYGSITVPAGTFINTIKVERQMSGTIYGFPYTGGSTDWWDRNVGPIKNILWISIPGIGELTAVSELISYSFGLSP